MAFWKLNIRTARAHNLGKEAPLESSQRIVPIVEAPEIDSERTPHGVEKVEKESDYDRYFFPCGSEKKRKKKF